MVEHNPRVTLWADGDYVVSSQGEDGGVTLLSVPREQPLFGIRTDPTGIREVMYLEDGIGWVSRPVFDAQTKYRLLRAELGPWAAGASTVRYRDGIEAKVTRSGDYDWDQWEGVHSPPHTTTKGWAAGDNKGVSIWHPWEHKADGTSSRESFHYNDEDYKGHRTSSSYTSVTERDASGRETREISVGGSYDHTTGTQEKSVTIRYGNGDWVKQIHRDEPDGSWSDTTTTKQDGVYVVRTSSGHQKGTTDTYRETEPSTEDPTDSGEEEPQPEAPGGGSEEKGSPTGDDTGPGGEENPDGPLAGIDVRDLIGDDGPDDEDLDSMGDLNRFMRPYLDRIRATLLAGGGGTVEPGELLDTLGAPPVIDIFRVGAGSGTDPGDLLDDLGAPPPIFGIHVDVNQIEAGGIEAGELTGDQVSALTVTQLQSVAGMFARAAATVGESFQRVGPA